MESSHPRAQRTRLRTPLLKTDRCIARDGQVLIGYIRDCLSARSKTKLDPRCAGLFIHSVASGWNAYIHVALSRRGGARPRIPCPLIPPARRAHARSPAPRA